MKKTLSSLVLAVLMLAHPLTAFADDGHPASRYFSIFLGAGNHPNSSTTVSALGTSAIFDFDVDPGLVFGGSIGLELENHFRVEGEFTFHGSTIDDPQFFFLGEDLDIDVYSFMANGYYDFHFNSPLKPYIGVGLGFALIRGEGSDSFGTFDEDFDLGFAYQLMVGFAFEISPRTALTLGYRYFGTTDAEVTVGGATFETEFSSHEIVAGVHFRF